VAHALEPVVQVGPSGVTDAVIRSLDAALLAHELVKVRLHDPEDKRAAAARLAEAAGAALCGLIGHTVILYRPHPENQRITLA
jgi:RNA-binding protein